MTPMPSGMVKFAEDFFQALAFLLVLDFAGDAALVGVGEEDEVTAGQDEVGGDAGALGADRALGDLDDDVAARGVEAGDVLLGDFGFVAPALASRSTISTPLSKLLGTMSQ